MEERGKAGSDGAEQRFKQRAATAEVNGRRVNEAIERGEDGSGAAVFVCECGHIGCNETVELSIAEYEAVRTDFNRFLVVPGHVIDEVDRVIEQHPRHLVVVKREPEAQALARASDERSD